MLVLNLCVSVGFLYNKANITVLHLDSLKSSPSLANTSLLRSSLSVVTSFLVLPHGVLN